MGGLCDCFTHTNPLLKTDLLKVNLMCYAQCSRQQNTYAVFILQLGVGEIHLGRKVLLQYTTTVRNSEARSVQKPCWLMNVDDFSGDYTNHDSMIFINFRRMGKSRSRDHRGIPFSTKRVWGRQPWGLPWFTADLVDPKNPKKIRGRSAGVDGWMHQDLCQIFEAGMYCCNQLGFCSENVAMLHCDFVNTSLIWLLSTY